MKYYTSVTVWLNGAINRLSGIRICSTSCHSCVTGCWHRKHTSPYPDLQLRAVQVLHEITQIFVYQISHQRFENHLALLFSFLLQCAIKIRSEGCTRVRPPSQINFSNTLVTARGKTSKLVLLQTTKFIWTRCKISQNRIILN